MIPAHIVKVFALLGSAYPNWKPNESTILGWRDLLDDIPPEKLLKAAIHLARTSEYPPTIAAIRNAAIAGGKISADEAWEICRRGEKPPNESAARAIKAIGSPFARGTHAGPTAMASAMSTLHAHFRDAYNAYESKDEWHREEATIDSLAAFNRADLLEMDREELLQIDAGGL